MTIRVALVDDHTVVREAVAGLLAAEPDIKVVGQAGSLAEAKSLVAELGPLRPTDDPLVLVVDVSMPDGSGLGLVRAVRERSARIGLVVLTMHGDDATLLEALDAGASALVRKSAPSEEVLGAVRTAAVNPGAFSAMGLAEAMRRRTDPVASPLTPREAEVLQHLAAGSSVAQVGKALFMSPSTVKTHIAKIYDKLGAHNRASAVMAAVRLGLVRQSGDS